MTARPRFDRGQIARLRLQALGITSDPAGGEGPAGVVRHHLAMQGQDFRASLWAVGSRMPGSREADILTALDMGEVVRSWPMRGTVHLVASEDLPWMLELLGVRMLSGCARRQAQLGIDEAFLERAREVAIGMLQGGGRCTRSALVAALSEAGLEMTGQRAYHTVWYLSQTGTLVQGPTEAGEPLLVLLDEWIRNPRRLEGDAALAELGLRYLRARGPASTEDLVHWTKLPKSQCRRAFLLNGASIVEVEGPAGSLWMLAEHLDTLDPDHRASAEGVFALPAFDEHLLGYRVRDAVLDPAFATRVDPGRNGVFRWTVVAEGEVVATWSRTRRSRYTLVEVTPFAPLPPHLRQKSERALESWAAFAETPIQVRWSDPT